MTNKKEIGPSFYDELKAFGDLIGEHFSWYKDGTLEFFEDTPEYVVEGVQSVYAAHDPTYPSLLDLKVKKNTLMSHADTVTMGMSDAYIGGLLTLEDEVFYKNWAAYKLALSKTNLSDKNIIWPDLPE